MEIKTCTSCQQPKLLNVSNFYIRKASRDGFDLYCKICRNIKYNIWRRRNQAHISLIQKPISRRFSWRKQGIKNQDGSQFDTLNYESLLLKVGNKCEICGTDNPGLQDWCVDHNHKTGFVRGILCQDCNLGIGRLKDDLNIVKLAMQYLESH